jgi:precorrin-4/cobalt-precorrin-4 C11-methyltransferase
MEQAHREGETVVRLHTGDASILGPSASRWTRLDRGIPFDVTPGVSSFSGAAAALRAEYTCPAFHNR